MRLEIAMNQVKTKKLGFRYFCRFFTPALTFAKYIVCILQFLNHFQWVLEARSKLTQFRTKL